MNEAHHVIEVLCLNELRFIRLIDEWVIETSLWRFGDFPTSPPALCQMRISHLLLVAEHQTVTYSRHMSERSQRH